MCSSHQAFCLLTSTLLVTGLLASLPFGGTRPFLFLLPCSLHVAFSILNVIAWLEAGKKAGKAQWGD